MHSALLRLPASCPSPKLTPPCPPPSRWLQLYAASQMFTPIKGRLGVQGVRFVSLNTTKAKYRVQLNGKCTEFDRTDAGLEAAARHADQLMLAR